MTSWAAERSGRARLAFLTRGDVLTDLAEAAASIDERDAAWMKQVHGARVEIVNVPSHGVLECDALITTKPHLALLVQVADCQAFAIYAPEKHVLAAVHAGWRGMSQRILTHTVERLQKDFGVDPSQLSVWAGPSLCTSCAVFTDAHAELPHHLHPFVHDRAVDLRAAADHELLSCGVPLDHIARHPDCTKCEQHLYWSYRAHNYDATVAHRPGDVLHRNVLVVGMC